MEGKEQGREGDVDGGKEEDRREESDRKRAKRGGVVKNKS